jgi:hypothetical protein
MNEETVEQKSEGKSGTVFGIVCIVLALGVAGYIFRDKLFKKSLPPQIPVSQSASSTAVFTLDINKAIDQFISTRIIVLSPIAPATGTAFTVKSIEHTGPGETRVVYSDTTQTYTAKGVFQITDAKNLNIVSFDIISTSSPALVVDEGQELAAKYIALHLEQLSPEKAVLGGKFYITKITFENAGNAIVEYEDGHIALRAHVSFMVDGGKNVEVLKWEMLSEK